MNQVVRAILFICISFGIVSQTNQQDTTERHSELSEQSKYEPTSRFQKVYPCPEADDIMPCVCTVDSSNRLSLDCSNITSNTELNNIFTKDFPVSEFYEFKIDSNEYITELGPNVYQNVTFERINIWETNIHSISENALATSAARLNYIYINRGLLNETSFPFHRLADYVVLDNLYLDVQREMTAVPIMSSDSVTGISFYASSIATITPGKVLERKSFQTLYSCGIIIRNYFTIKITNNTKL